MRTTATLALASLFLLSSCNDEDKVAPRPPVGPQDIAGQEFHFKVKAEEWVAYGTPGDDTHGYTVNKNVYILTDDLAQNGTVQVYVKRANNNFVQLPLLAHEGAPGGVNWRFSYRANLVQIFIDKNGDVFSPADEVMSFKVVVFGGQ